jgi:hypothetical protein
MKTKKIAALIALVAASSTVHAGGPNTIATGVIRFTGSIVVGACELPTTAWNLHAGRDHGISPRQAGAVPPLRNDCAGIGDTYSISMRTVADSSGKIVTVTFN